MTLEEFIQREVEKYGPKKAQERMNKRILGVLEYLLPEDMEKMRTISEDCSCIMSKPLERLINLLLIHAISSDKIKELYIDKINNELKVYFLTQEERIELEASPPIHLLEGFLECFGQLGNVSAQNTRKIPIRCFEKEYNVIYSVEKREDLYRIVLGFEGR